MNYEQMEALLKTVTQMSAIVKQYYEQLIGAGFNEEQALSLTMSFQKSMMAGAIND
jgi:hypothetical protein